MARIDVARYTPNRRLPPDIGLLRDVVIIATTVERPDGDVSSIVLRPGVIRVQAQVRPISSSQLMDYWRVLLGNDQARTPSHEVVIRYPRDIKIDMNHWVYHQDRRSPIDTWFKVRYSEDLAGVHRFVILGCTIEGIRDRRTDPVTQQAPPKWSTPDEDSAVLTENL